jgi:hypothetical protein
MSTTTRDREVLRIDTVKGATYVKLATDLNREIREKTEELAELKGKLRKMALEKGLTEDSRVEVVSDDGMTATISYVAPRLYVQKGAVPERIRGDVGEEVWNALFEKKVCLREGANAVRSKLEGKMKKLVDTVLELRDTEAAVNLPK